MRGRRLSRARLLACVGLLGLCLSACSDSSAHSARGLSVVNPAEDPRPYFHDFGLVPFGESATHVFQLRNEAAEPITIRSVQGGCACIRVSRIECVEADGTRREGHLRSKEDVLVVPPGALVEMAVRMDTSVLREPNKDKLEILRMATSSDVTPYPTFELHVKSQQLFQITPRRLVLGDVPTSAGAEGVVAIVTAGFGDGASLLEVVQQGQYCEASLEREFVNGENLWTLQVRVRELLPKGPIQDEIVLSTTDEHGQGDLGRERIEVWAQITDDVVLNPRLLSFAAFPAGSVGQAQGKLIALVPGARVTIEEIEIRGPMAEHLHVDSRALAPDASGASQQWELVLSSDESLPAGRFDGELRVRLDDSQTPELLVNYSGFVR